MKKRLKQQKGFTLIELLIVIAIIAVLAVIIIPRVTSSLDKAKETTKEANIKLVQSAVERYYFDTGNYPTSDGNLPATGNAEIDLSILVENKYIDQEPENFTFYLNEHGVVEADVDASEGS